MTNKYLQIRREMFEKHPARSLKSKRNLGDILRLFKNLTWIIFSLIIISIISVLILYILFPDKPFLLIPMVFTILLTALTQNIREKHLYNNSARVTELTEKMDDYEKYISDIKEILINNKIDSHEKLMRLKSECETILKRREDKFTQINSKIIDMLIGVPLGALIASIIYSNNNAVPVAIVAIVFIGFAFLCVVKITRFINNYSEGYFKDKYILDAINEIDYFDFP